MIQRLKEIVRKRFNDNKQRFFEYVDYLEKYPSEFFTTIGVMDSEQQNDVTFVTDRKEVKLWTIN